MENYEINIGRKVRKVSKNNTEPKPFKSGLKINTIKGVINHPTLNIPAYTFNEDDSYVEVRKCKIIMNMNKTFDCMGNDEADSLLCMLESNSVLSNSFTLKIQNIVLTILTNLDNHDGWVNESIIKLKEEMGWLNIFSDEFKGKLISQLLLTYHTQKRLNKKK